MNSKQLTGSIFLDLRKAFDVIPLNLILEKMKYYGIRNSELEWFTRYLMNIQQCVLIQGTNSTLIEVKSGVPQGSILGPLIFCLYIKGNNWVRVLACAKLQRERINCTSVYLFLYGESSVKISTQTDSY